MKPTVLTIPWIRMAALTAVAAATLVSARSAEEVWPPIKVGIIGLDAHAVPGPGLFTTLQPRSLSPA